MRWRIIAITLAIFPYGVALSADPGPQSPVRGPEPLRAEWPVPSPLITRAEAVYRLVESDQRLRGRAAWHRSHMPPLPLFHDVPQEDAIAPYLEAAFEAGIIPGNRERLFYPRDPLRMEEAQAMIERFRGEGDRAQTGDVIFFVQPISRENFIALLQNRPIATSSLVPLPNRQAGSVAFSSASSTAPSADLFAISIPTLGIDRLQVSHPNDPMTHAGIIEPLKRGVGHLFGFPGGGGKVMIYGHSSGYPWDVSAYTRIFRGVNRLDSGDAIELAYQGRRFAYRVTGQERVAANDLRPFQEDTDGEELILYTCWPPDSTSERLLVRAVPVKTLSPWERG